MPDITGRQGKPLLHKGLFSSGRRSVFLSLHTFFITLLLGLCGTDVAVALGPMATRIVGRVAKQRLSWERGNVPPGLASEAKARFLEQTTVKGGRTVTLGEMATAAKGFAESPHGEWTKGFHFWNVPQGTKAVGSSTGSCGTGDATPAHPCIWKACLNYTERLFNEYGSLIAGASGTQASTGVEGISSLGFMVDLLADLHSPVRMGATERYGSSVRVNVDLNGTKFSTTEWGLWEEDTYLSHALESKGFHNWTDYADSLPQKTVTREKGFIQATAVKFGDIGCLNDAVATGMFSTWANQSHARLGSQVCLEAGGCPDDFFNSVLFDALETQILLCAYRTAKAVDLLFVTPPDNVVGASCRKNIPFNLDNNIMAISVSAVFAVAAILFFCVFLPQIKKAQSPGFSRPNSPDSPLSTGSTESSMSYKTMSFPE